MFFDVRIFFFLFEKWGGNPCIFVLKSLTCEIRPRKNYSFNLILHPVTGHFMKESGLVLNDFKFFYSYRIVLRSILRKI